MTSFICSTCSGLPTVTSASFFFLFAWSYFPHFCNDDMLICVIRKTKKKPLHFEIIEIWLNRYKISQELYLVFLSDSKKFWRLFFPDTSIILHHSKYLRRASFQKCFISSVIQFGFRSILGNIPKVIELELLSFWNNCLSGSSTI